MNPTSSLKSLAVRAMTSSAVLPITRKLLLNGGVIFTLHRFAHPMGDTKAPESAELDSALATLARLGCRFVPLDTMLAEAARGRLAPNSVAFTVDDGYFDFFDVALPVFEKHSCPVAVFLVTGFIDGELWLWWDQVQFVLNAGSGQLLLSTSAGDVELDLSNNGSRRIALDRVVPVFKRLPHDEKEAKIAELARRLDVAIPDKPPPKYRPLTWDQARSAISRGASFGPHSHTHPILALVSDVQAEREIASSWARVRQEIESAIPVLAYPNGNFTQREVCIAERAGLKAALTTAPGHLTDGSFQDGAYRLPRFDLPSKELALRQIVSGVEAAKHRIRHRLWG